jgi:hypothetical protein
VRATEILFYLINALPAPLWACWIFAPRSSLSRSLAQSLWPWAILATVYVVLIGTAMLVFPAGAGADMGSLGGVMKIFDSEWATLGCWAHYLCFDAFVGRWIMNDAPDAGYRLAPILALTLFFGPAGLLLYLALRARLR